MRNFDLPTKQVLIIDIPQVLNSKSKLLTWKDGWHLELLEVELELVLIRGTEVKFDQSIHMLNASIKDFPYFR